MFIINPPSAMVNLIIDVRCLEKGPVSVRVMISVLIANFMATWFNHGLARAPRELSMESMA